MVKLAETCDIDDIGNRSRATVNTNSSAELGLPACMEYAKVFEE